LWELWFSWRSLLCVLGCCMVVMRLWPLWSYCTHALDCSAMRNKTHTACTERTVYSLMFVWKLLYIQMKPMVINRNLFVWRNCKLSVVVSQVLWSGGETSLRSTVNHLQDWMASQLKTRIDTVTAVETPTLKLRAINRNCKNVFVSLITKRIDNFTSVRYFELMLQNI
jgi:hypothetical protein